MLHHRFGKRSLENLHEVNLGLCEICTLALDLSPWDFAVTDGIREIEEQREYVRTGKSRTLNSRHLHGFAIDVAAYVNGRIEYDNWELYEDIATAMFRAAHMHGRVIEWGGHFGRIQRGVFFPFPDGVHFQFPKETHPDKPSVLIEIRKPAPMILAPGGITAL